MQEIVRITKAAGAGPGPGRIHKATVQKMLCHYESTFRLTGLCLDLYSGTVEIFLSEPCLRSSGDLHYVNNRCMFESPCQSGHEIIQQNFQRVFRKMY
jgi:hypothetical protein